VHGSDRRLCVETRYSGLMPITLTASAKFCLSTLKRGEAR